MKKQVIATEKAPSALGPYSQGIAIGDFIFTSGQIPVDPTTGDLVTGDIKKATAQCIKNVQAVLEEAGSALEKVIKTTVFLQDLNNFTAMNEEYACYFSENPPARSCVQVAKLPKDSIIEIEVIAKK